MANLKSVKRIHIKNLAQLSYFPDFTDCEKMEELIITGYQIPKSVGTKQFQSPICGTKTLLNKLKLSGLHLDFSDDQIASMLRPCKSLATIDLSENDLTVINLQKTFTEMPKLISLNLSNNALYELKGSTPMALVELDLSGNKDLRELPLAQRGRTQLQTLFLGKNQGL
jgi:Leucine-rich repeat (LRR) protein